MKLLLLLAFVVGVGKAYSQQVVATLYLSKKEPRPMQFEYSSVDDGLVTIGQYSSKAKHTLGLFKYDAQFRRQWVTALFEQTDKRQLEQLVVLGDKILVFAGEYLPKEKTIQCLLYQFTLTGKQIGEPLVLLSFTDQSKLQPMLSFAKALDKKQLLAYSVNEEEPDPKSSVQAPLLRFAYLNASNDSLATGELVVPHQADAPFELKDVQLGVLGNVFLLGKRYPRPRRGEAERAVFVVLKYSPSQKELVELPLNFQTNYVTDLTCRPDRHENLILAGFYSQRAAGQILGILYGRVESITNEVSLLTYQPLQPEFLARYLSTKQIERGRELNDFYLDHLILRSDGGAILMAERFYLANSVIQGYNGLMSYRTVYHYEDVVVVSLSANGTIEWSSAVAKSQVAPVKDELSYALLVGAEQLYVLYKTTLPSDGTNVFYNTIGFDGVVSVPKPFFGAYRSGDVFYRRSTEQISNSAAILVYYQRAKQALCFSQVTF